MNKHKSNKIKENSNTVRHLIKGQITTTKNLVAIKEVRHAGQQVNISLGNGLSGNKPLREPMMTQNCVAMVSLGYNELICAAHFWFHSVPVNTLRPRGAYMCHQTKPLSEPMLNYCKVDPCEHISVKF